MDFDAIIGIVKYQLVRVMMGHKLKGSPVVRFSRKATIKARKGAQITIGAKASLSANAIISATESAVVNVGSGTGLNYGTVVVARERIDIGSNVLIGPNVAIYDHNHIFNQKEDMKKLGYKTAQIKIEDNVWIGANAVILKGVTIGTGSVIAAGTVVTKSIPAHSLVSMDRELTMQRIEYR